MGIQDAVPPGAFRGLPGCPGCGRAEDVVSVPAIHESALSAEKTIARARMTLNDDDAMTSAKTAAHRTLASTPAPPIRSAVLAPAPQSTAGCSGCAVFVFGLAAAVLWAFALAFQDSTSEGDHEHRALVGIATAVTSLTALFVVGLVAGIVRHRGVKAGRSAADVVWRRGWYCTRCASIHFAHGEEPAGVHPGETLDPDGFRRAVWTAGGYGGRFKASRR